jgi:hypothetical protein
METEPTFAFAELQAQEKVTAAGQLSDDAFTDDLMSTLIADGAWDRGAIHGCSNRHGRADRITHLNRR